MEEKVSKNDDLNNNMKPEKKNNNLVIGLVTIIVILIGIVVYLLFFKGDSSEGNGSSSGIIPTSTPTPTPTATPTPTPTATPTSTPASSNQNVDTITKLDEYDVKEENETILLKDGTINVKTHDSGFYANDERVFVTDAIGDGSKIIYKVYHNDNFDYAFVSEYTKGQCTRYIAGAVNSKGEFVKVDYEDLDVSLCVSYIYLKDGKIYGKFIDNETKNEHDLEIIVSK